MITESYACKRTRDEEHSRGRVVAIVHESDVRPVNGVELAWESRMGNWWAVFHRADRKLLWGSHVELEPVLHRRRRG